MSGVINMLNKYTIKGDAVYIHLNSKKYPGKSAIINLSDFDTVASVMGAWYPSYNKCTKSYYAVATVYTDETKSKQKAVRMHILVCRPVECMLVDHINHDTLDNRRENLRECTPAENAQNRKVRSDNKSGHRGVSWRPDLNKWQAQACVKGVTKSQHIGYFDNLEDAVLAVKQKRKEIMTHVNEQILKERVLVV